MQYNLLSLAALVAGATAQNITNSTSTPSMNLTSLLAATPDLSTLTGLISQFPSLLSTLSTAENLTIVAPNNNAFTELLESDSPTAQAVKANDSNAIQALLSYHVREGAFYASQINDQPQFIHTTLNNTAYANVTGGQVVESLATTPENAALYSGLFANSTFSAFDVNFTGGVVHIVNSVLTIPTNISTTAVAANLTAAAGALTKANLVSTLDELKDVTVFVPSNEAFNVIGSATANLSTNALASILQYHVVQGTVAYSSLLENGTSIKTLAGNNLTITIDGDNVFVNSAKVITPDVLVANGVVHVIDNVLNPNATSAMPDPAASTQSAAFAGASAGPSGNALTSGVPTPTSTIEAPTAGPAEGGSGGETPAPAPPTSAVAGAAAPRVTGAVGVAGLLAAGGVWLNY